MAPSLDKTVAVITTGGTIGAVFGKGLTTLNHDSQLLKLHIEALSKNMGLELKICTPLNKFSEDMEPADWGTINATIEECIQQNIKQIVITHGTDTLAYSAMATSLYYSQCDVKICFTCAFYPPSAPESDAAANIEAALYTVTSDAVPTNVYVAFSRDDKDVIVARAQDIAPVAADKTIFEPLYGEVFGIYNLVAQKITIYDSPQRTRIVATGSAPTSEQLSNIRCKIIQWPCYPGISLDDLNLDTQKENLVILIAYHSGTMPALALRNKMHALKKTNPETKFVLCMHPFKHVQAPYETTTNLAKEGALNVYRDILSHQIYTLAVCETSKHKSLDTVLKMIEPWRF